MRPKRRSRDLIVQAVGEELVVYDRENHRAHRLDPVAAALWYACDGESSAEELTRRLQGELGRSSVELEVVTHGLDELARAALLLDGPTPLDEFRLIDRRSALRAAALLVPVVSSIVAPTPARAQTFFPPPPPPPPPEPPFDFSQFNGAFDGRAVLVDAEFSGFSARLDADVTTDVDDRGEGQADVATSRPGPYDPGPRSYQVVIGQDGRFEGSGTFTDDQGRLGSCSVEGRFRRGGNRIRFTEMIEFPDGMRGVARWEFTVNRSS